jgi:sialate O-acetylesterase
MAYSGPTYDSMATEGDAIRIRFQHAGSGLTTSNGAPPSEFTIAGTDGHFFPAQATIDGNTVLVKSDHVPAPTAVRFAWSDAAVPNLISRDKLPASIFRTD